jgi:hypothetical protein
MNSQAETRGRSGADDHADIARVFVALGLLALLASFDGAEEAGTSATPQVTHAEIAASAP